MTAFTRFDCEKVERFTHERAASLVFGFDAATKHGTRVVAVTDKGHTLHFSRVDGGEWRWDAHFASNGFPVFVHGAGSLMSSVVTDPLALAVLNEAAKVVAS